MSTVQNYVIDLNNEYTENLTIPYKEGQKWSLEIKNMTDFSSLNARRTYNYHTGKYTSVIYNGGDKPFEITIENSGESDIYWLTDHISLTSSDGKNLLCGTTNAATLSKTYKKDIPINIVKPALGLEDLILLKQNLLHFL